VVLQLPCSGQQEQGQVRVKDQHTAETPACASGMVRLISWHRCYSSTGSKAGGGGGGSKKKSAPTTPASVVSTVVSAVHSSCNPNEVACVAS
jgi:hypothetical protein